MNICTEDQTICPDGSLCRIDLLVCTLGYYQRMLVTGTGKLCLAHVYLIPLQTGRVYRLTKEMQTVAIGGNLRGKLLRAKGRHHIQQAETEGAIQLGLSVVRVAYFLAKHLIAAAYTNQRCSTGNHLFDLFFQSALTDINHILCGIFAARQHNQINLAKLLQLIREVNIGYRYILFPGKAFKISKVGNLRSLDNSDFNIGVLVIDAFCFQGNGILVINTEMNNMRNYSQNRFAGFFLQKLYRRLKQGNISAEFIDNKTFNEISFFRCKQLQGTNQRCQSTSTVNICNKKNRSMEISCNGHVYNIISLKIYFGRAACTFDNNCIVLLF